MSLNLFQDRELKTTIEMALYLSKVDAERRQAEEALKRSEEKYRTLFEVESDALFLVDEDTGNLLEANEAARKLYGYSHEELVGLKAWDLSAEPEKTKKAIKLVEKTFLPIRYHKKKDGTVFPVEINANDFTLDGRKINLSAIRDITVRKLAEEALRESEEKYRTIFNMSKDAIILSTEKGEILEANQSVLDLFGVESFGELKNYNAADFWIDPEDRKQFISNLKQKGFETDFGTKLKRMAGTVINVHASAIKLESEQGAFIISTIRDISKRSEFPEP